MLVARSRRAVQTGGADTRCRHLVQARPARESGQVRVKVRVNIAPPGLEWPTRSTPSVPCRPIGSVGRGRHPKRAVRTGQNHQSRRGMSSRRSHGDPATHKRSTHRAGDPAGGLAGCPTACSATPEPRNRHTIPARTLIDRSWASTTAETRSELSGRKGHRALGQREVRRDMAWLVAGTAAAP